jgi:hypothetical protein
MHVAYESTVVIHIIYKHLEPDIHIFFMTQNNSV